MLGMPRGVQTQSNIPYKIPGKGEQKQSKRARQKFMKTINKAHIYKLDTKKKYIQKEVHEISRKRKIR